MTEASPYIALFILCVLGLMSVLGGLSYQFTRWYVCKNCGAVFNDRGETGYDWPDGRVNLGWGECPECEDKK